MTGPVRGQPLNKASGLLSTSHSNENGNWQLCLSFMWPAAAETQVLALSDHLLFLHHPRPGVLWVPTGFCFAGEPGWRLKVMAVARSKPPGLCLQAKARSVLQSPAFWIPDNCLRPQRPTNDLVSRRWCHLSGPQSVPQPLLPALFTHIHTFPPTSQCSGQKKQVHGGVKL